MSSLCEGIIDDFGSSLGLRDLSRTPWYLVAGQAGPNAVLKIIIPPERALGGYVLSVARHGDSRVVAHEVNILNRLERALPEKASDSVPTVLVHGRFTGAEYFGMPFYRSYGNHSIARRFTRNRRLRWVEHWLTELGAGTRDCGLTAQWLEEEYAEAICRLQGDPCVASDLKQRVQESFGTICNSADHIPSVCCHGDLWTGNIRWQRGSTSAVVLDWGAARWPGLPCVDLCRFALTHPGSKERIVDAIKRYCRVIDLDPAFVAALYDLYRVFVRAELEVAYATQPQARFDPFGRNSPGAPS